MEINDRILKEYLKNVYFVTGTPCGGKTTISRLLGEMYGLTVYDVDERFSAHKAVSNPMDQPNMNRSFRNADEFFSRSVMEYTQWLKGVTREQLHFIVLDLIRLSERQRIVCDLHFTLDDAEKLTDKGRIAFLLREPTNIIEDYCNRPDHTDFKSFIESTTDVEKAKRSCNETLEALNRDHYERVKSSDYFWLERDDRRSALETAKRVAAHFGWM